jgi:hypothetical protein
MPKQRRPRKTMLKIRAIPLERMPKSEFFRLIKMACEYGIVPKNIKLTTMDWSHRAQGRQWMPGDVLSAADRQELKNCTAFLFGAVGTSDVRVERPDA